MGPPITKLGFSRFSKKKKKNEWVKNDATHLPRDHMLFTWFSTCPIKFHENWISIKDNSKPSYYEKWKAKRKIIQTEAKFVISIIQKPYYTYKCIYALYQSCNNGCNLQLKKKTNVRNHLHSLRLWIDLDSSGIWR